MESLIKKYETKKAEAYKYMLLFGEMKLSLAVMLMFGQWYVYKEIINDLKKQELKNGTL